MPQHALDRWRQLTAAQPFTQPATVFRIVYECRAGFPGLDGRLVERSMLSAAGLSTSSHLDLASRASDHTLLDALRERCRLSDLLKRIIAEVTGLFLVPYTEGFQQAPRTHGSRTTQDSRNPRIYTSSPA